MFHLVCRIFPMLQIYLVFLHNRYPFCAASSYLLYTFMQQLPTFVLLVIILQHDKQGREGSKMGQICVTSFMNGPLLYTVHNLIFQKISNPPQYLGMEAVIGIQVQRRAITNSGDQMKNLETVKVYQMNYMVIIGRDKNACMQTCSSFSDVGVN